MQKTREREHYIFVVNDRSFTLHPLQKHKQTNKKNLPILKTHLFIELFYTMRPVGGESYEPVLLINYSK